MHLPLQASHPLCAADEIPRASSSHGTTQHVLSLGLKLSLNDLGSACNILDPYVARYRWAKATSVGTFDPKSCPGVDVASITVVAAHDCSFVLKLI